MCDYLQLPPLLCAISSVLACLWLLAWGLCRVKPEHKTRLFVSDLWHLALSDLVNSLFMTAQFGMHLFEIKPSQGVAACRINEYLYIAQLGMGLYVSLFCELHMAAAFCIEVLHYDGLARFLHCALMATWPLGIAVALLDHQLSPLRYTIITRGCGQIGCDWVWLGMIVSCVGINSLVYLITFVSVQCRKWRWPSRVERRIVWRMTNYCLVAILTAAPGIWMACDHRDFQSTNIRDSVGYCFFALNGFLNFLVYACGSKFLQKLPSTEDETEDVAHPRRVTVAGDVPISSPRQSLSNPRRDARPDWMVGFRSRDSLIPISGGTTCASLPCASLRELVITHFSSDSFARPQTF